MGNVIAYATVYAMRDGEVVLGTITRNAEADTVEEAASAVLVAVLSAVGEAVAPKPAAES